MIVNKYGGNGGGGQYVLPAATQSTLGGVKIGSGLTITSGGTLSVSGGTGGGIKTFDIEEGSSAAVIEVAQEICALSENECKEVLLYLGNLENDFGYYLFSNDGNATIPLAYSAGWGTGSDAVRIFTGTAMRSHL